MAMHDFVAATARPLPVIILADISGSMAGDGKIENLNMAIKTMIASFAKESRLNAEIQVALVTFGGECASAHVPLTPAHQITDVQQLMAGGGTPMGSAFEMVTAMVEDKTLIPSRAYRPTIVLISDGWPTDEWEAPFAALQQSERAKKAVRMAMAIGSDADKNMMKAFINDPETPVFEAHNSQDIVRFFRAVSMSVSSRSRSNTPNQMTKIDFKNLPDDDDLDLGDF